MLGKTAHGEEVWLSRRAAESDLVLYLNINLVPMDGGHKSVGVGLAPYQSLRIITTQRLCAIVIPTWIRRARRCTVRPTAWAE